MIKKERLPKEKLKKLLIDQSILHGIKQGHYTEVVEDDSPSRRIPNGRSLIISYYRSGKYVCTKHELRTKRGDIVHQDVEAVFLGGTRYDRLSP